MTRSRILPEAAYDFYVRDGRDGEESPKRNTLAKAKKDLTKWRAVTHPVSRCCLTLEWAVNERKVLRLLAPEHVPHKDGCECTSCNLPW